MSYTALYRKFRPQTFDEVKGQDHIVTTLKNQISTERIGHAYLFCGTRGTGKTSVAKIFAKAVNCTNPSDGSPCGECEVCKGIADGSAMNVVEIDAASNNGVDNIRQIKDEIAYAPVIGKYTVYIIDEVHMLSIGAFNALLKTLEEPPEYVIFILATTEPHKIPITILSRCQRYDFKRITPETIAARLREVVDAEGADVEQRALDYIAKAADGSMRDSLSLLDQCMAFYIGKSLTYDDVLEVLGAADTKVFGEIFDNVVSGNVPAVLEKFDELITSGREPSRFVADFIWYIRNLLLIKASSDDTLVDVRSDVREQMKLSVSNVRSDVLMRYIRILSDLSGKLRASSQKRILIEVELIKMCKPQTEQDAASLSNRIMQLEKKLEKGDFVRSEKPLPKQEAAPKPKKAPIAVPEDVQYVVDNWNSVLRHLESPVAINLEKGKLYAGEGNRLIIVFDEEEAISCERVKRHADLIAFAIEKQINKTVSVDVKLRSAAQSMDIVEVLSNKISMDIEEE